MIGISSSTKMLELILLEFIRKIVICRSSHILGIKTQLF
ncbi:hypothetical protein LEP1GSC079_4824 [Leptospira interrogans str. FPW1039]|uniref:Uncharacterized protein n=2 Tax=Leptospira interrogans TaxID=173 RepID=A0A0E2D639_LEPIR|nr:hypothetical protein LEP1GSC045_3237 [Leptospira interrogans serovar Pomona str. Kennewicki LC82-25]EKO69362.1 hypothetical protein LEP1GSC069_3122 [Leptospira interrogans serovar Canicola str. Fiocruz LV133]EKR28013.1 hypothetical protein LEP1GSC087_0647 [Leptospira interrogans serovar Bataviae str. L1111]EKR33850.1 hypothetical protein LEP1GSC096_0102 [Leptospira interrogans serovar Hebdomadis str. R499]EKR55034.1 hypothetical protein LEP1GSC105_3940 [Leptospira interrogans str. UI 12758]